MNKQNETVACNIVTDRIYWIRWMMVDEYEVWGFKIIIIINEKGRLIFVDECTAGIN